MTLRCYAWHGGTRFANVRAVRSAGVVPAAEIRRPPNDDDVPPCHSSGVAAIAAEGDWMGSSRTRLRLHAVTVAVAMVLALSACSSGKGSTHSVSSPWPRADAEKVVPRPSSAPRWPLTGADAPNGASVKRRVVSVKVENSAAARPQTGLNKADIVYESLAEGGVTRFNALFHSQDPALIGPVRSARLSDTWIVPQYDGLFFFSGASRFVTQALRKADIPMLSEDAGVTRCYTRVSWRPSPHNLYLKADLAREEGVRRGYKATQTLRSFAFDRSSKQSTVSVASIQSTLLPAESGHVDVRPRAERIPPREQRGKASRRRDGRAAEFPQRGRDVGADARCRRVGCPRKSDVRYLARRQEPRVGLPGRSAVRRYLVGGQASSACLQGVRWNAHLSATRQLLVRGHTDEREHHAQVAAGLLTLPPDPPYRRCV